MYNLPALEAELENTAFAGMLHFVAETDSTSDDAMAAARSGAPHGSVYLADAQSAGKGRGGHAWQSASGEGLYVSVVLRPQAPQAHWSLLPLCAGLAAIEAIRDVTGLTPDLRWPNDVLLGERKVCGILMEAGSDVRSQPFAVVGIGINVHQRGFSGELATPATSLDLETGGTTSRQTLLLRLLESLQQQTASLADEAAPQRILAALEAASTWVRGRRVEVHGPQASVGLTDGLDQHGFLRVQTATGIVTVQTGGIRAAHMD
jgi:BirA family biotin operon repressor/biotin-[acetyl-CoA-carboxylase] ligase